MRNLLLTILLSSRLALAAISSTTAWDVRTTGSDSNGGGFQTGASGIDYSQQNSAQCTYTDLVIGATNTQLTSVGCPFDSTSPGNIVNVTGGSGFTAGRYQVVSVAIAVATMDRAVGTASSTSGTGTLGGSLLTIATALTPAVDGNLVYIQSGTYTQTSTLVSKTAIGIIGFASTHSDNGTPPLITTATNSTDLWHVSTVSEAGYTISFQNLKMSNTAGTRALGITYANSPARTVTGTNLVLSGFTHAIYIPATAVLLSNVEIAASTSSGYFSDNGSFGALVCQGCYIHGNGAEGVSFTANLAAPWIFVNSIIASNTTSGIGTTNNAAGTFSLFSTDIANNTGDGVKIGSGTVYLQLSNCIVYGNGGYGINYGTGSPPGMSNAGQNNAFGANSSGNISGGFAAPAIGQIALSANPFTSSTNFALNSTAGGGASLKAAGYPGTFPGGTTIGYLDVGAVQSQGGSSGGTNSAAYVGDLAWNR